MSTFVRAALAAAPAEEETFGPLEDLQVRQEGLELVHETGLAIDRYDAIVDSAQSLEAMATLTEENPQSLESLSVPFEVASSGYLKDDLSLEGISSFLKKVWDAIVKAWEKLKEMIGKLIDWVLGRGGKQQNQDLRDLQKEGEALVLAHNKSMVNTQREVDRSLESVNKYADAVDDILSELSKDPGFVAFEKFYNEEIERIFDQAQESKKSDDGKVVEMKVAARAKETSKVAEKNQELAKGIKKATVAQDNLTKAVEKKLRESDPENESELTKKLRKAFNNQLSQPAKVLQMTTKEVGKEIGEMKKASADKSDEIDA